MNSQNDPFGPIGDLDPVVDPARWEALVGAINARALPVLSGKRESTEVASIIFGWARRALSVAASIIVVTGSASVLRSRVPSDSDTRSTVAEAIVPEAFAAWLVADYAPTVSELVVALEEVAR
jgi:hypothetical protein